MKYQCGHCLYMLPLEADSDREAWEIASTRLGPGHRVYLSRWGPVPRRYHFMGSARPDPYEELEGWAPVVCGVTGEPWEAPDEQRV